MELKVLNELKKNIEDFVTSDYNDIQTYERKKLLFEGYFDTLINDSSVFSLAEQDDLHSLLNSDFNQDVLDSIFESAMLKTANTEPSGSINKSWYRAIRNKEGKILHYEFNVKTPKFCFRGKVTREELEEWVSNYSLRGAGQTASEVCLSTNYTTEQFRAILRTFKINKSTPYTLHEAEENTTEELINKLLNSKELKTVKSAERRERKDLENRYVKLLEENISLKKFNNSINDIISELNPIVLQHSPSQPSGLEKDLLIWLSDWHIGARVDDTTNENFDFTEDEFMRRLDLTLENLPQNNYDTIVISVLGDMIDGFNNQTTRGGHMLPQSMGDDEQLRIYVKGLNHFIQTILTKYSYKNIRLVTVRGGNHDGFAIGYLTEAIFKQYSLLNENITTQMIDSPMFGHFLVGNHLYIISHGKDPYYAKRGLSVTVTDKDRSIYLSYLLKNNLNPNLYDIHIVKGDLHQDNYQQVEAHIDVRTVASLFGASDYSARNFAMCNAGTSYEIINEYNNIERGVVIFD